MARTVVLGMLALLMVSSTQAAQLLVDSMNYADDAALRAVWKDDYAQTADTQWTYNSTGLSFANHFASAGGSTQADRYDQSFRNLDSTVQITGSYGEDEWKGRTFTFYMSFLMRADAISASSAITTGAAIRGTGDDGTDGFGAGFGGTDPLSSSIVSNISVGDEVDGKWTLAEPATFSGGTAMATDTTYLLLAKFVYVNQDTPDTYNPYQPWGTVTGSLAVFEEGDAYPTSEAGITWDVTETNVNSPRGANTNILMASLNGGLINTTADVMLIDELRIGTEYDDVMVVPEPATMSLLAFGGMALLRRRRW